MKSDLNELTYLITGMRDAYTKGENAMAWARGNISRKENLLFSTLVAYDLQAGSYVASARKNPDYANQWCGQLASFIRPYIGSGDSLLEVGVGEATTLSGVLKLFDSENINALGLDVSWSRIKVGQEWVAQNSVNAKLFVGDLFRIPLADNSVDVIYTSHSLEPNGGKELAAITELLRVARKAVVLIEPIYELATELAQKRMLGHGYVSGLKSIAEKLGNVVEYGLLDVCDNPLNPSGVILITKKNLVQKNKDDVKISWQCPFTASPMTDQSDIFLARQVGIAYPVVRGVAMLRAEHSIVASLI